MPAPSLNLRPAPLPAEKVASLEFSTSSQNPAKEKCAHTLLQEPCTLQREGNLAGPAKVGEPALGRAVI